MKLWGTIYLMRPDWDGSDEDIDRAVVEAYEPVKSALDVAMDLWRLAGDHERAAAIEALLEQVYDRDNVTMTKAETEELLRLLDGFEDALFGNVVDKEHWIILPELLPELRACTTYLDLDENNGELGLEISGVLWLQKILREALDRKLLVSLD
ncbi:MAG: hypothetical protein MJE77_29920 [Proteobacteria bacterium]|nr:hypothetical protein [Pseudomonadota bacterium]